MDSFEGVQEQPITRCLCSGVIRIKVISWGVLQREDVLQTQPGVEINPHVTVSKLA